MGVELPREKRNRPPSSVLPLHSLRPCPLRASFSNHKGPVARYLICAARVPMTLEFAILLWPLRTFEFYGVGLIVEEAVFEL